MIRVGELGHLRGSLLMGKANMFLRATPRPGLFKVPLCEPNFWPMVAVFLVLMCGCRMAVPGLLHFSWFLAWPLHLLECHSAGIKKRHKKEHLR